MSALEQIGQFTQGLTQGAGQGMDLYSRFQTLQDEGETRRKRKEIEQKVIQMHQDGTADKDPVAFSDSVANMYLEQGDIEHGEKWRQAAQGARDLKTQKLGLHSFAVAQVDPIAAIPYINQMFEAYGNNNRMEFQPTPNGGRLLMNVDGKNVTKDYTQADMDRFRHDLMQVTQSYVMKPEDMGKLQVEQERGAAYARNIESEIATRGPVAEANIAQSRAAAQSALAAAGNYAENARTERESRAGVIAAREAETELRRAQTAHVGIADQPAPQTADQVIDNMIGTPQPDMEGVIPPSQNKMMIGELAHGIEQAGAAKGADAAYLASSIANTPVDQLGSLNLDEAMRTGQIKLPSGQSVPFTSNIASAIARVIRASQAIE